MTSSKRQSYGNGKGILSYQGLEEGWSLHVYKVFSEWGEEIVLQIDYGNVLTKVSFSFLRYMVS